MAPPIRSLLFVPGDSEAKAQKALASEADAIILDLEDAVAPEAKGRARETVRAVLDGADRGGKPVFVRINALDTGLAAADLAAVMGGRPWGVVLPKYRQEQDIHQLGFYLEALEAREGIDAGATRLLIVATETAAAAHNLGQPYRLHSPRLWGAMWGGEDLAAELGSVSNRDGEGRYTFPFLYARSQCLYGASALGIVAVDAVHTNFRDLERLEAETREGLRDGFIAKAAIHPAQVGVINKVLTPDASQVAWAEQVTALLADQGVARLDGKMIDLVHKRIADRILERATSFGLGTR